MEGADSVGAATAPQNGLILMRLSGEGWFFTGGAASVLLPEPEWITDLLKICDRCSLAGQKHQVRAPETQQSLNPDHRAFAE